MVENGNRRLWRVAGLLAIGHVALMFGSFSFQKVPDLGAGPASVAGDFAGASLDRGLAGAYLTCLAFLVFLAAATLLAQLLRGRSDVSGWLASTLAAAGAIYVAITLGTELANLGAARYGGHHRAPVAVLTALNHAHWFGVFLATAVLGLFTLSAGGAMLVARALPRWVGVTGIAVGLVCLAGGAGDSMGLAGGATLLWSVWFVLLAVAALRGPRPAVAAAPAAA